MIEDLETFLEKVDVIILTPGKSMSSEYVESLVRTTRKLDERGITWHWFYGWSTYIHEARQIVLNKTNGLSYKKAFWIDSDISWKTEDFFTLLESDKKIVSGVYVKPNGDTVLGDPNTGEAIHPSKLINAEEYISVAFTGFAWFQKVRRGFADVI